MLFIYFFAKDGVWDWINKHNAEDIAATMKAEKPWIEETREFFGLVILLVVLAIDYFYAKKRAHRYTDFHSKISVYISEICET